MYAQDDQESKAYSLKVNFLVRAVSFTVERTDTGDITVNDLPTSKAKAFREVWSSPRFADGNAKLNSTRVLSDGSWSMDLTAGQLSGVEGQSDVIFEMDGQIFKFAGQTDNAEFAIVVSSGDNGVWACWVSFSSCWRSWCCWAVPSFIEFEDVIDEDELTGDDAPAEEDPYAWAKAKQTPSIPQQEAAAPAPAVQEAAAPAASQHPGWLWDQASNQWVPDPNYHQPPQQ